MNNNCKNLLEIEEEMNSYHFCYRFIHNKETVYIGQSKDYRSLYGRIHHYRGEDKKYYFENNDEYEIVIAAIHNKWDLNKIEQTLIKYYDPIYNYARRKNDFYKRLPKMKWVNYFELCKAAKKDTEDWYIENSKKNTLWEETSDDDDKKIHAIGIYRTDVSSFYHQKRSLDITYNDGMFEVIGQPNFKLSVDEMKSLVNELQKFIINPI